MTPPTAALALRVVDSYEDAVREPAHGRLRSASDVESADVSAPIPFARPDEDGALWRNGRFETDVWTPAAEGEAVAEGPAIVPLARFLAEHEILAARKGPIGVLVQPGEAIDALVPLLGDVALVVLVFPKFADGRSMSTARLLRERYAYRGEIRASGDVLIDQMPLMRRCGFDAFEVANPVTRKQLKAGKWPEVVHYMQPLGSSTQPEAPAGTRPWLRRPGKPA